ncbi:MAG TPA: LysR family transcriptional regulator [Symbiobacteriaceae bacterium]|nr:LysR family transcriptional regulator [Symbiobacteriaceae bacterium]
MNAYLLEVFATVVETRRITTAARMLNLTQPAVSHQIKHLESYFGVPLLARGAHGAVPTPAGEILYRHAKQILSQFECLEREIDDLTNADEREVLIGASPTAGNYALPCSLWTFKDRFPKANLQLQIGQGPDMARAILQRGIHLAVVEGPVPEVVARTPGVKCRPFTGDDLICATPARGPWDKGKLTPEAMTKAPLALPGRSAGMMPYFEQGLRSQGLALADLNVMSQLAGLDGMKSAVEMFGGVLVCTRMVVQRELRRGLYRDVTPEWLRMTVPFHLIYIEDTLPPVARRFIRFIAAPEELASCWEVKEAPPSCD